jgi:dienelactone hydrolase
VYNSNVHRTLVIILAVMAFTISCREKSDLDQTGSKPSRKPEVIFFHGMYLPEETSQVRAYKREFIRRAADRGYIVQTPKGGLGLCEGLPEYTCWPNAPTQGNVAKEILATYKTLDPPPVLVGFSHGGYFALKAFEEELQPVSALVLAHAGANGKLKKQTRHPPPTLLLNAIDDPYHYPRMISLHEEMKSVGWTHQFVTRPGKHEFNTTDMDAVLDFLDKNFP